MRCRKLRDKSRPSMACYFKIFTRSLSLSPRRNKISPSARSCTTPEASPPQAKEATTTATRYGPRTSPVSSACPARYRTTCCATSSSTPGDEPVVDLSRSELYCGGDHEHRHGSKLYRDSLWTMRSSHVHHLLPPYRPYLHDGWLEVPSWWRILDLLHRALRR